MVSLESLCCNMLFCMITIWTIRHFTRVGEAVLGPARKAGETATRPIDIDLEFEDVCLPVHVFTRFDSDSKKETQRKKPEEKTKERIVSPIVVAAAFLLLMASVLRSGQDAWESKRDEAQRKLSLIEFATLKHARRELAIAHLSGRPSFVRKPPAICRMDSANSYLGTRSPRRDSIYGAATNISANDSPGLVGTSRTPLKLLGARPVLLRRSSFPVAPRSLDNNSGSDSRRMSFDSEDDSSPDTSHRRVRIIRRH